MPARQAALEALRAVDEDDAWSNAAVPLAVSGLADERDRAFASHLAYDTLRWRGTLDWALGTVLTRPLDEVEPALQRILRLGALQVVRSSGVPARAAVDTSVALARDNVPSGRADGAAGFVNGVLRGLVRRVDDLPWPDPAQDPVHHLVLSTAHPAWVVLDLLDRYPLDRVAAILAADDVPPGLTLRVTTGDRAAVMTELSAAGLEPTRGRVAEAIRVPGGDPRRMPAVAEGRAVPQDEASMRVVHAVAPEPGQRVLDLCAGPGGKTTHLAALVGQGGSVTAVELHPHRAQMIRDAAAKQGVDVDVVIGDARNTPLPDDARFDRVLLDAPCTGLGTGRRRPEIRWRRTPDDVRALADLQLQLLQAAATRVGPGGTLTYSVCTWTGEETDGVADRFASIAEGMSFEPVSRALLLPDRDETDGMFIATWRRGDSDVQADGHG